VSDNVIEPLVGSALRTIMFSGGRKMVRSADPTESVMPVWTQNLVVVLAVLGCVSFIAWQGFLSLRGRKSKLNGCGSCSSCGTMTQTKSKPASTARVQIIPADLLRRR